MLGTSVVSIGPHMYTIRLTLWQTRGMTRDSNSSFSQSGSPLHVSAAT
jgi:hypothetical protein